MTHLHLAILAYWLVNTVCRQLKIKNKNCHCRDPSALLEQTKQIVRIANTQKVFYSSVHGKLHQHIEVKKCSDSSNKLKAIYQILKMLHQPFTPKCLVHKLEIENY